LPGVVLIVDYDPQWPTLFGKEKDLILRVVGQKVIALEHIGSTAVPGLGAKPIIDMMAGVTQSKDADECLPPLDRIGYTDVTPQLGNPDWYYCLAKHYHNVGYHLHLVRYMSDHWKKHLVFRDYLRKHSDVAEQYHRLKKELSSKYGSDRVRYTEAKTSFIESVILLAQKQNDSEQVMSRS